MSPLITGALLGFSIAAPVGPIGLLCIQRSVNNGVLAGLACGLGAATADASYGAVAAFGLTVVSGLLLRIQAPLQLAGGLFLLYLGIAILRQKPATKAVQLGTAPRLVQLFGSTWLLTLANPMTILSFSAVFAGLGLGIRFVGTLPALSMVIGVFLGSALWWCILSGVAGLLGSRLTPVHLGFVNVAAGVIIMTFAAWQLGMFVFRTHSG